MEERPRGEADEHEADARQQVRHVGIRGEEGEVHGQAEVGEEEEAGRRRVGSHQHREEAQRHPDETAQQEWQEELGVVAGREGDRVDGRIEVAARLARRCSGAARRSRRARPRRARPPPRRRAPRRRRRCDRRSAARGPGRGQRPGDSASGATEPSVIMPMPAQGWPTKSRTPTDTAAAMTTARAARAHAATRTAASLGQRPTPPVLDPLVRPGNLQAGILAAPPSSDKQVPR